MELTINELHFMKRQIEARIEWINDNPDDFSEEEGEIEALKSLLSKLENIKYNLEEAENGK